MAPHPGSSVALMLTILVTAEQSVQEHGGHHLVADDGTPLFETLVGGQHG